MPKVASIIALGLLISMLFGACSSRKKEDKMTSISNVTLKVSGMKEVNGFL